MSNSGHFLDVPYQDPILRACDWNDAPFGKLQALPKIAKPVTNWNNIDEAFTNVAKGIRKAVEELRATSKAVNMKSCKRRPCRSKGIECLFFMALQSHVTHLIRRCRGPAVRRESSSRI